jgi:two-component system sensor histidine kinase KdpD
MNAGIRKDVRDVVLGTLGIAVVTLACYPLHLEFAVPAFLYLLVVVALSTVAGFAPAAITSILGVACLAYFFIPPLLDFRIANPLDGVAAVTYLLTSLIITRLASKARMEARTAENKRRDLALLYKAAYRLLSAEPQDLSSREVLRIFREVFALNAVCLFDASTGKLEIEGESAHGLADRTRKASLLIQDEEDSSSDTSIRYLNVAGEPMGAVGFEGLRDADSVAGPLSVLAASMLERTKSFAAAATATATAQAEVLRTAILDAMAHQFNSPLAAILTSAGAIREAGPLAPQQLRIAEMIEDEAVRLGLLTRHLLRAARVDTDPVQPRLESTNLAELVARTVETCRAETHMISLQLPPAPLEVKSDRELLAVALTQLVDNASKYSTPDSTVAVRLESKGEEANVRVSLIASDDQERIFERSYRGASASATPGTGLGLYVARKIVLAHGGSLYLEKQGPDTRLITFCLSLPLLNETQTPNRHLGIGNRR